MTIMSGDIASRLSAVSTSVSPLMTLELAMATLRVSALRRFSATSNDVRVRVLGSKNRLTTVRPRSVGTFLIGRAAISFIASAVSRMSTISSGERSAMPSRCLWRRRVAATGAGAATATSLSFGRNDDFVMTVYLLEQNLDALAPRRRQVLPHVVRFDWKLAMPAVHQHHQLDRTRAAEIDQGVECRSNGPAGIEHIVDQQDDPVVDRERDVGEPHDRLWPDRLPHEVVPVQRDVERPGRHALSGDLGNPVGDAAREVLTARANADERQL